VGSWHRIVAGVIVVAAMVSACQGRPARPPKLTVAGLGPKASADVIARGTINGKQWSVRLTLKAERSCDQNTGLNCLETVGDVVRHWRSERPTNPANVWTFSPVLYGPVRPDVTRVSMRLSDGVVDLHPVEAFGHRWIGIVLPAALTPVEAVAYAGRREVGHSVPYVGPTDEAGNPPVIEFLSWLAPGDRGPVRATKTVSGAGLSLVLHSGPWGNVVVGPGAGADFPLGFRPDGPALWFGGGYPQSVPVVFPSPARYLLLGLASGKRERVQLVLGAGLGFAIIRLTSESAVRRWDVYDALGRRLSGGQGPPGL
jgi:hypothetical protein